MNNKKQFLNDLEKIIKESKYSKENIITLLHNASGMEIASYHVFENMLELTYDERFAFKMQNIYNMFNFGSSLFEKVVLQTIEEAREIDS